MSRFAVKPDIRHFTNKSDLRYHERSFLAILKVGAPVTSREQACFEEQMDAPHQNPEAGQFKRVWNSGRTLTMEQALGFALEENTG